METKHQTQEQNWEYNIEKGKKMFQSVEKVYCTSHMDESKINVRKIFQKILWKKMKHGSTPNWGIGEDDEDNRITTNKKYSKTFQYVLL